MPEAETLTRTLPIDETYCHDWTVSDALRELLQNAIDSHSRLQITRSGDFLIIRDEGPGISLSDFLLGRTSKSKYDDSAIGQFGEGLTVACLVLQQHRRHVSILSRGKRFLARLVYDEAWEGNVLAFDVTETAASEVPGTAITVECTEAEEGEAKRLFLKLHPKNILEATVTGEVLDAPGSIYVNGLLISTTEAIFGYNLSGAKALVNRDRGSIGRDQVQDAVKGVLGAVTDKTIIRRLLDVLAEPTNSSRHSFVEGGVIFSPQIDVWREVIEDKWGEKACISDNSSPEDCLAVGDLGWEVLSLPWGITYSLTARQVIPTASEARTATDDTPRVSDLLSTEEKALLAAEDVLCSICPAANLPILGEVKVAELSEGVNGITKGEVIYLSRRLLQTGLQPIVKTLLHEHMHVHSGAPDHSALFEHAVFEAFSHVGLSYHKILLPDRPD